MSEYTGENDKRAYMAKRKAEFCVSLMANLYGNIDAWCEKGAPSWGAGYETPRNSGQNRTAIKADIARLRRELLALSKVVDE